MRCVVQLSFLQELFLKHFLFILQMCFHFQYQVKTKPNSLLFSLHIIIFVPLNWWYFYQLGTLNNMFLYIQTYGVTVSLKLEGTSGDHPLPLVHLAPEQDQLEKDSATSDSEYIQRWTLHRFSRQPMPVCSHPHSKMLLLCLSGISWVWGGISWNFTVSLPVTRHH